MAANNRWLSTTWDALAPTVEAALTLSEDPRGRPMSAIWDDHAQVFDRVLWGDADAAVTQLGEQFGAVAESLVQRFRLRE